MRLGGGWGRNAPSGLSSISCAPSTRRSERVAFAPRTPMREHRPGRPGGGGLFTARGDMQARQVERHRAGRTGRPDRRTRSQRCSTRSPGSSPCKPNTPPGTTTPCRIASATPLLLRPCRPSSIWISMNSPPSCRRGGTDAIDRPGASNVHPQLSGKICRAALAPLDEHQGKMRRDNRQWQPPTVTACRSPAPAQASASGCS